MSLRLFCTISNPPTKKPRKVKIHTHAIPPMTLNERKCLYVILPIPATKGANVRTIGTKRARIIVFPPCFS